MIERQRFLQFPLCVLLPLLVLVASGIATAAPPAPGVLNVASTPAGAQIYINGKSKGVTPQIMELAAGEHTLRLQLEGYEAITTRVRIASDRVTRLQLKMKTPPVAQPKVVSNIKQLAPEAAIVKVHVPVDKSKPGTVFLVTTPPGLLAFIDQQQVSHATPVSFDIRPGVYELVLRATPDGEVLYRKTIFVRPSERLDLELVVRKQRALDYSDPWR
ncbi:MAG: PEGA domain-containing protein [Proteobacteria bacterium]|nr:PEGA domain-containing protein [Pseudomonadota bacterium]